MQAEALCYLLGDVLKNGIRRAVEAMPYPTAEGLPRAERGLQLKSLDEKIAKLEADLVAIHRSADATGVRARLDPLPGKLTV